MRVLRAIAAFLILPGVVAFFLPWLLLTIDPRSRGENGVGEALMIVGAGVLLWCVRDFFVSGGGTLAPWDAPQKLVVTGLYRYTRNPMYVGVILVVAGIGVAWSSPVVLTYAAVLVIGFHIRVVKGEEPTLEAQFGNDWREYAAAVPRWRPRFRPWRNV